MTSRELGHRVLSALRAQAAGILPVLGSILLMGPTRVWGWIWTRPWEPGVRIRIVLLPWGFLILLATPHLFIGYLERYRPEPTPTLRAAFAAAAPIAAAERGWIQEIRASLSAKPSNGPPGAERQGSVAQDAAAWIRSALLTGLAAYLAVALFGGPAWVVNHLHNAESGRRPRIAGRYIRKASGSPLERWRRDALHKGAYFVGVSETGQGSITLTTMQRATHSWVVGGSGTGKTQGVLLPMLRSDILAGRGAYFLDGKADVETVAAIWKMVSEAGRESDFHFVDLRRPAASCTYSPMLAGTANEQADRIMQALTWDSEYYRAQSLLVLLTVLRAAQASGNRYSLDDVVAACSDLVAAQQLLGLVPPHAKAELQLVIDRWKDFYFETAGMRSQLAALLMTDFGELLKAPEPTLDLARVYAGKGIVYFALPVARYPETAAVLAKLVIGDLNSVAGMVQDGKLTKAFTSVIIDEFAAFATPHFTDLLNKARSAGLSITIAHQSMCGDLEKAGDGYIGQVADNTNVKIILRQLQDAEYAASLSGTRAVMKATEQVSESLVGIGRTGMGSLRHADEWKVSPNLIRELGPGMAVCKVDQAGTVLDLVRLDFVDASAAKAYLPEPAERPPQSGLNLRSRAAAARAVPEAPKRRGRRFDPD